MASFLWRLNSFLCRHRRLMRNELPVDITIEKNDIVSLDRSIHCCCCSFILLLVARNLLTYITIPGWLVGRFFGDYNQLGIKLQVLVRFASPFELTAIHGCCRFPVFDINSSAEIEGERARGMELIKSNWWAGWAAAVARLHYTYCPYNCSRTILFWIWNYCCSASWNEWWRQQAKKYDIRGLQLQRKL